MRREHHSHGKLLITGEYLILRGARGLALPTSRGQQILTVPRDEPGLEWLSYSPSGEVWFQATFDQDLELMHADAESGKAERLRSILLQAKALNPGFLTSSEGYKVDSRMEFPRNWGLGSSSTLIHSIATWAQVDPFQLSDLTLGGSGYDIAVAMRAHPLVYHRGTQGPVIEEVPFLPRFMDDVWFVHTGQKKDSREALEQFKGIRTTAEQLATMDRLTKQILDSGDVSTFNERIREHEHLMERILQQPSASTLHAGYKGGALKFLGAWGGDFMMVTGSGADLEYFKERGMDTVIPYQEMILI